MKKRILFSLAILLLTANTSIAQNRRVVNQLPSFDKREVHWGFYLGLNQRDFKVKYQASAFSATNILVDTKPGFNVGLIGDIRLNNNINLRVEPGLSSSANTIHFVDATGTGVFGTNTSAEINSTYFHLPFLLKVSTNRLNNMKPYIIGGISYDYNFSSNQNNPQDNSNNEFRMTTHNFMYEIGLGVDFYFHYFKFSPSIRGQFALTNEIHPDEELSGASPWTDPIEFMGTKGIFLKLAFE
jgi:hypothetical protein